MEKYITNPNNAEKALKKLIEKYGYDTSLIHQKADKLLCRILKELGFDKVVEIFEDLYKWYH